MVRVLIGGLQNFLPRAHVANRAEEDITPVMKPNDLIHAHQMMWHWKSPIVEFEVYGVLRISSTCSSAAQLHKDELSEAYRCSLKLRGNSWLAIRRHPRHFKSWWTFSLSFPTFLIVIQTDSKARRDDRSPLDVSNTMFVSIYMVEMFASMCVLHWDFFSHYLVIFDAFVVLVEIISFCAQVFLETFDRVGQREFACITLGWPSKNSTWELIH